MHPRCDAWLGGGREKKCLQPRSRTQGQGQTDSAVGTAGVKWAMAVSLSRVLLLCQQQARAATLGPCLETKFLKTTVFKILYYTLVMTIP
jgi:hypothetical protein